MREQGGADLCARLVKSVGHPGGGLYFQRETPREGIRDAEALSIKVGCERGRGDSNSIQNG